MNNATEIKNPWLRSAGWDGFWMLSGIWLLAPLLLFSNRPTALQIMLLGGTALFWLSHRFATTYNAFCTPAYRDLVRMERSRFILWPTIVTLLTFTFVFVPNNFVKLDTWGKVQILGTIFFLYNSYHFGVQHYGVLSIYRIRAGQAHGGWLKRYERFFCIAVGTVLVAIAQICHGAQVVNDSLIYNIIPRVFFLKIFDILRLIVPTIVVLLSVVFYVGELKNNPISHPKMFYVFGLMLQGVFAYFLDPISFLILWGVQHWLVSVALGAHMAQNDTTEVPKGSLWYNFWNRFNKGFWPTIFVLCLGSVLLAPLFEFAVHPEKMSGSYSFLAVFSLLLANTVLVKLFIALNFVSVYIHFIMDRAIFRFSDPNVRKISVPLLFKPITLTVKEKA